MNRNEIATLLKGLMAKRIFGQSMIVPLDTVVMVSSGNGLPYCFDSRKFIFSFALDFFVSLDLAHKNFDREMSWKNHVGKILLLRRKNVSYSKNNNLEALAGERAEQARSKMAPTMHEIERHITEKAWWGGDISLCNLQKIFEDGAEGKRLTTIQ